MPDFPLKPSQKPVKAYFAALAQFQKHGHTTEGNTRSAFADLLKKCASPYGWHLVEEFQFRGTAKQKLRADGALIDELTLQHGIWEAKDNDDDLEAEVKKKRAAGYPFVNTLFQSPSHAILYQRGRIEFDEPITTPEKLVEVLEIFFSFEHEHERDWEEAVIKFSEKIPDLAQAMTDTLAKESKSNGTFRERFASFADLARQSINPDLSDEAVNKMLVQHLLTERIFRKVFNNPEFTQRNVIAAEIEKVIASITARHFSRDAFLKQLDRFYTAIEKAAEQQQGYTEKQHFLNAVYEKFFQSFDRKQADTHGIVYTPQPIVDFMVRSVEEILRQEFGKSLSDSGVHILDPFTGTGNFITRIMQQIKRSALPQKYAHELHCNEVMLLPYYIASMNIEHAYLERANEYRPFEGICLVDTFDLTEANQSALFVAENTARVRRQRETPIKVVVGNPPYNVGQKRDNDNNKNRSYKALNQIVAATYAKSSAASSKSKLDNPYVKAIRWASDRIGKQGVVAYITESGYLHQHAFDGMRYHLASDFDAIYVFDLAGDVTTHPQYAGSTHNVFGIRLGVSISFFVKNDKRQKLLLKYTSQPANWRRQRRLDHVAEQTNILEMELDTITPDKDHTWLTEEMKADFTDYVAMRVRGGEKHQIAGAIFARSSIGSNTGRDAWAYSYSAFAVERNASAMISIYEGDVERWAAERASATGNSFDQIITTDETKIKWSSTLRAAAKRAQRLTFDGKNVRPSLYRPFTSKFQYFDKYFTHRRSDQQLFFPANRNENKLLIVSTYARSPFAVFASDRIADINFFVEPVQTFPFYLYDEDGTNRRENISDWALNEFRTHYADTNLSKWDIFHATYAVLHHPEYRIRYAANLKRELPRIPFPPDFHAFAAAGKRLMELHIYYEQQPEYPLQHIESEDKDVEVSFRVTRMKLSKDKTELRYNDFLLLRGIPPAVFDYRLGNRSALQWVIDQYRVTTDTRSGITNDPNREDDPKYILRLVSQVITVSLETNKIIASLPSLRLPGN